LQEHALFQNGLRMHGTQWRLIQRLVPTRSLVQIRTHAQKYFQRIGHQHTPSAAAAAADGILIADRETGLSVGAYLDDEDDLSPGGDGSMDEDDAGSLRRDWLSPGSVGGMSDRYQAALQEATAAAAGAAKGKAGVRAGSSRRSPPTLPPAVLQPVATLRHVLLEPLYPTDPLGIIFRAEELLVAAAAGSDARRDRTFAAVVDGFVPVATNVAAAAGAIEAQSVRIQQQQPQQPVAVAVAAACTNNVSMSAAIALHASDASGLGPIHAGPLEGTADLVALGQLPPLPTAIVPQAALPLPVVANPHSSLQTDVSADPSAAVLQHRTLQESASALSAVPLFDRPVVPGAAEESDLVRIGDVVVGVSGFCVAGMHPEAVIAAIAAARNHVAGGQVVLHLCDVAVGADLVEEASLQVANAAAQLFGSRSDVEAAHKAILASLLQSSSVGKAGAEREVLVDRSGEDTAGALLKPSAYPAWMPVDGAAAAPAGDAAAIKLAQMQQLQPGIPFANLATASVGLSDPALYLQAAMATLGAQSPVGGESKEMEVDDQ
jgi:hypothetical protein